MDKKTGRDNKTEVVRARVTGAEKEIIVDYAEREKGMTVSAFFRSLLYAAIPALRKRK
jgi:hypothetical protein